MDQKIIIAIILGVLVIISAVQTFQLYTLKEKVATSGLKTSGIGANSPTAAGSNRQIANVPTNTNNLPQMVGGC